MNIAAFLTSIFVGSTAYSAILTKEELEQKAWWVKNKSINVCANDLGFETCIKNTDEVLFSYLEEVSSLVAKNGNHENELKAIYTKYNITKLLADISLIKNSNLARLKKSNNEGTTAVTKETIDNRLYFDASLANYIYLLIENFNDYNFVSDKFDLKHKSLVNLDKRFDSVHSKFLANNTRTSTSHIKLDATSDLTTKLMTTLVVIADNVLSGYLTEDTKTCKESIKDIKSESAEPIDEIQQSLDTLNNGCKILNEKIDQFSDPLYAHEEGVKNIYTLLSKIAEHAEGPLRNHLGDSQTADSLHAGIKDVVEYIQLLVQDPNLCANSTAITETAKSEIEKLKFNETVICEDENLRKNQKCDIIKSKKWFPSFEKIFTALTSKSSVDLEKLEFLGKVNSTTCVPETSN